MQPLIVEDAVPRYAIAALICALAFPSSSGAQMTFEAGELTQGQWSEGLDFDPFGGMRPVQLWLPSGTLLFDVKPSAKVPGEAFVEAVTYHGVPVHLRSRDEAGGTTIRPLAGGGASGFRLNRSVFCPASLTFAWHGPCPGDVAPVGEGWTFFFAEGDPDAGTANRVFIKASIAETDRQKLELASAEISTYISKDELKNFERRGDIFRLDRDYPAQTIVFVGDEHFQCGSEKEHTITRTTSGSLAIEGEVSAGFDFFGWLKSNLKTLASAETKNEDANSVTVVVDSSKTGTFVQWGVAYDNRSERPKANPFRISKSFECNQANGLNNLGDKIESVLVRFWDESSADNVDYEFQSDDLSKWINQDPEIYKQFPNRPIFISINEPRIQADFIRKIIETNNSLSYSEAVFIYSQLNNACSGKKRETCAKINRASYN